MPEIGSVRARVGEPERGASAAGRDRPGAGGPGPDPGPRRADGVAVAGTRPRPCFARLRRLREQGVGIIYISHRLEEIRRLADRITVLRDGRNVGTRRRAAFESDELVRLMVGRDVAATPGRPDGTPARSSCRSRTCATTRYTGSASSSAPARCSASPVWSARAGPSWPARSAASTRSDSGRIAVDGRPIAPRSPGEARAAGIVLVPGGPQGPGTGHDRLRGV